MRPLISALGVDPASLVAPWLQVGVTGAAAVVLAMALICTTKYIRDTIQADRARADELVKLERDRADRTEAKLEALHASIRTDVIPVMTRATEMLSRSSEVLADAVSALRERRRS